MKHLQNLNEYNRNNRNEIPPTPKKKEFTAPEKKFIDFIVTSLKETTEKDEQYKIVAALLDEFNNEQGFY